MNSFKSLVPKSMLLPPKSVWLLHILLVLDLSVICNCHYSEAVSVRKSEVKVSFMSWFFFFFLYKASIMLNSTNSFRITTKCIQYFLMFKRTSVSVTRQHLTVNFTHTFSHMGPRKTLKFHIFIQLCQQGTVLWSFSNYLFNFPS